MRSDRKVLVDLAIRSEVTVTYLRVAGFEQPSHSF